MIDYFYRVLRFKNLELWDITINEKIYRMCICDESRPATFDDLDLPQGMPLDEDELRGNLITVTIFSNAKVNNEHIDQLDQFSKQLTDHVALAHCNVITTFRQASIDDNLSSFVKEHLGIDYKTIPLSKLRHLSQD